MTGRNFDGGYVYVTGLLKNHCGSDKWAVG